MAKFRSPVLGFNHNVRHRGWLFHVQTEDSGIQNPHLFTHLFHEGVILATRKIVYDAEADVEVVKGLMQAQHKAVLRELKGGKFDDKIKLYLGDAPAAPAAAATQPVEDDTSGPVVMAERSGDLELKQLMESTPASIEAELTIPEQSPRMAEEAVPQPLPEPDQGVPRPVPSSTVWVAARPGQQERPFERSGRYQQVNLPAGEQGDRPEVAAPPLPAYSARRGRPTLPPVRQMPGPPPRTAPPPARRAKESADGVVVARPAVVIGGPAPQAAAATPKSRQSNISHAREVPAPTAESIFGQDLISEKSLDEVIMAYLSEDSTED